MIGRIALGRAQPIAIALYERGNTLFVADGVTGNLLMINASTRRVVSSVRVGRDADLVVNERAGKVYVASDGGLGNGNGTISVINAKTGTLITRFDPGAPDDERGEADFFRLVDDGAHGKVYVSMFCPFCTDLGVIDVATDEFTTLRKLKFDESSFSHGFGFYGINERTNEAFAVNAEFLYVVHGATRKVQRIRLPRAEPLDVAVNEVKNKLYFMCFAPDNTFLILNRRTGKWKVIPTREDLEPLVFNPRTNRLFAGVQVGELGAIVDGATDKLTYLSLNKGTGMGAGAVREATDNAYFASTEKTFVVNGRSKRVLTLPTGHRTGGGVFAYAVVIDERRGLVYVVNNQRDRVITVIKDGVIPAR